MSKFKNGQVLAGTGIGSRNTTRRQFMSTTLGLLAAPLLSVPLAARAGGGTVAPWQLLQVSTDHLDIEYAIAGPETGRPVLLVHPPGGAFAGFAGLAAVLATAGLRVIAPSLRGHGGTRPHEGEAPGPADPALLGHDLLDLIDAIHVPEAVLVASGAAADAALAFATLRPSRCKGVLLAGGPAGAGLNPTVAAKVPLVTLAASAAIEDAVAAAVAALVRSGAWRT
ncbi:MAG: alpha/beta fold hydrolase [Massilia sp.]